MESILNVPLEDETKKQLKEQAKENGRSMNREAAKLIKDGLRRDESGAKPRK